MVAATTGAITLSGLNTGDSLDGVTLSENDRILIKNQTTGSQNGIYTMQNPLMGSIKRTQTLIVVQMFSWIAFVFVEQGTTNGDNGFVLTNNSVTLGSTALVFVQFSGVDKLLLELD